MVKSGQKTKNRISTIQPRENPLISLRSRSKMVKKIFVYYKISWNLRNNSIVTNFGEIDYMFQILPNINDYHVAWKIL